MQREADVIGLVRVAPHRLFTIAMLVSGTRCLLTYVVLPFGLPLLGVAGGVGPAIGAAIAAVAVAANVSSIRRFWHTHHPSRKPATAVHLSVIGLLLVLLTSDISALLA